MGFLVEILESSKDGGNQRPLRRDLISEEDLLKTHSKEMYLYLKSTLRYEVKVPVKKTQMMDPNFDVYLETVQKNSKNNTENVEDKKVTPKSVKNSQSVD